MGRPARSLGSGGEGIGGGRGCFVLHPVAGSYASVERDRSVGQMRQTINHRPQQAKAQKPGTPGALRLASEKTPLEGASLPACVSADRLAGRYPFSSHAVALVPPMRAPLGARTAYIILR